MEKQVIDAEILEDDNTLRGAPSYVEIPHRAAATLDAFAETVARHGIRSTVRAKLFGSEDPRFTGYVAWRGLVPMERLSASLVVAGVIAYDLIPIAALPKFDTPTIQVLERMFSLLDMLASQTEPATLKSISQAPIGSPSRIARSSAA